jgi:putative transposase
MVNPQSKSTVLDELLEEIIENGTDAILPVMQTLLNFAMKNERSQFLQAEPYQRVEARRGHANGYKDKTIDTRMGRMTVKIPQVRGLSFYPKSLEKGCRSERALKLAIAEMYVNGVSTRKVTQITEALCGLDISVNTGLFFPDFTGLRFPLFHVN